MRVLLIPPPCLDQQLALQNSSDLLKIQLILQLSQHLMRLGCWPTKMYYMLGIMSQCISMCCFPVIRICRHRNYEVEVG